MRRARLAWTGALVVAGLAATGGVMLVAVAVLDHSLPEGRAVGLALAGLGFLAVAFLTVAARARWYENHAIFVSWRDLVAAVHASIARTPLFQDELEELRRFARERSCSDAPLKTLYEKTQARRRDGAEAEQEFRWLASLIFRFMANVHHVSAHTTLTAFTPKGYRLGYAIAGGFVSGGLGLLAAGLLGLAAVEDRVAFVAAGVWGVCVGVGLWRRWRWGWWQALGLLVIVAAGCGAAALQRRWLDAGVGVGVYVPLLAGLYLFRHRRWFTES